MGRSVARLRRQAPASLVGSVAQTFLVGCLSSPPPLDAPRVDIETKFVSSGGGPHPVGHDIADGGIGPSAGQGEVASTYAATQPCDGFSPPAPSDAGTHRRLGVDGGTVTNGHLDPALVQQVVRSRFGAMRLCYEYGMSRNRNLSGRVTTKLVIGLDGAVTATALVCTSMPDDVAVDCIVNEFARLSFPKPEGGTVTVVYPVIFKPGD
jgi:hypothetical protein